MTPSPRLAPLTAQESGELDALLARVCLPTFTERERDTARHVAREAQRLARSQAEEVYRRTLWLSHGHDGLYGDDGEMQCSRCRCDYKRAPLDEVVAAARSGAKDARARERRAVLDQVIALFTTDVVVNLCSLARTSGNVAKEIDGRMTVMTRGAAVHDYLTNILKALRDQEEA